MDTGYLTMPSVAAYLDFTGKHQAELARRFVRQHGFRTYRRGARALTVKKSDLDFFMAHGRVPGVALRGVA